MKKILITPIIILLISFRADAGIYLSGDLKVGYGTEVSEDTTTILSRKMASYAAEAAAGFQYNIFILGLTGEYALVKQLTDPSNVSNTNTQGKLMAVSPLVGLSFGSVRIIAKLPTVLAGSYVLDQKNSSGQEVTYKDATILGGQIHLITGPNTFWGIEYQSLKFKKVENAGIESTLNDSQNLKMNSIAILYGLFF